MTCPMCARPTAKAYRPFCSRRCAELDLGLWLTERYRTPAGAEDEDDRAPDEDTPRPH